MSQNSLEEVLKQKERYKQEVIAQTKKYGKKVAYHFNCPDGLISAVLFKYVFSSENLIFIPIDYPMLKDKEVVELLKKVSWFAIVDLSPFNLEKIDYFFDHHISNSKENINAHNHVFEASAPSAASLIAKYFRDTLPEFLKELAEITEITDTASYTTPAPLEIKSDSKNYSWDEKIWLLEDACKSTFTVKEHNLLIDSLVENGWEGLWKEDILERVGKLRLSRKDAYEKAQEIELTDFIVLIDSPQHYNTAYIAKQLMKRGSTGIAYITVFPEEIKLSFRLSKALNAEMVEKYRVDLLANSMSGGGHKGASGAEMEELSLALKQIKDWTEDVGLNMKFVDLREE